MSQIASALPVDVTLRVPRAHDVAIVFEFRDEADAAVDLTGDTLACHVHTSRGGPKAIDPDPVIVSSVPASGDATLTLTAAQLDDGQPLVTRWYYVIDRTHAGKTTAWFGGVLEIYPVADQ